MSDTALQARAIKAVLDLQAEVKPMAKSDENKFGKYYYVNIDRYYAAIKSLAPKHGVYWRVREDEVRFVPTQASNRDGTTVYGLWRFVVDLIHVEAESVFHWPDYDRVTLYLPHTGAQSTGAARSYAEKAFMRSLLKMVTGEEDADYMRPSDMAPATEAAAAQPESEKVDWEKRSRELIAKVEIAESTNAIDAALKDAAGDMRKMKAEAPEMWADIRQAVVERRTALTESAATKAEDSDEK